MSKILQTPSINAITPFDPSADHEFSFTYQDNQAVKNYAVITDNATGETVYENTQTAMRLSHILPADTLTAGGQYLIRIQVFDADGNYSYLSEPILFYCFTAPQFYFENIHSGDHYKNANILLTLNYTQPENEPVKSIQFFKYSYDKSLISKSDIIYSTADMSYTFSGLDNNRTYYFRAIGETNHGIKLDTGYVEINISYDTIAANIIFEAKNIYNEGYIRLSSNIIDIGYSFENDDYELKDGMLTLKNNSITYREGLSVEKDFILLVEAKQLPLGRFLTTSDDSFSLSLIKICNSYYCRLTVKNSNLSLYAGLPKAKLMTDDDKLIITDSGQPMEIVDMNYDCDDLVMFEVKRINHYYSLKAYYKSDYLQEEENQ